MPCCIAICAARCGSWVCMGCVDCLGSVLLEAALLLASDAGCWHAGPGNSLLAGGHKHATNLVALKGMARSTAHRVLLAATASCEVCSTDRGTCRIPASSCWPMPAACWWSMD